MSAVNYEDHLRRIINAMLTNGTTIGEILAIVLAEEQARKTTRVSEPTPARFIDVQLQNGATKKYEWTPELQAQLDKEARAKVQSEGADGDGDIDALLEQAEKDLAMLRKAKAAKE
jgi:dephospho-CoA kinase